MFLVSLNAAPPFVFVQLAPPYAGAGLLQSLCCEYDGCPRVVQVDVLYHDPQLPLTLPEKKTVKHFSK
jgi:hypothetical protein